MIKGDCMLLHIRHTEFDPGRSAAMLNPTYFKMALSAREDRDSHCTSVVQSLLDNFLLGIFSIFVSLSKYKI